MSTVAYPTTAGPDASRLFDGKPKIGVGVYDGLSALLAAKENFDFLWVSSFSCSAATGLPDVGIIGADEILAMVRTVKRLTPLPIVVDLDAGYGDPLKIYHVVDAMVRAGAAALCIEDNPTSKRCSLYPGHKRDLASPEDHVARIRAAREAVKGANSPCRIIARTEALVAGMGIAEALSRCSAYVEAGADGVFVQSLDATGEDVLAFARKWNRRTPIFIAPTRFPHITRKQFISAGISHQIFANQALRAAHAALVKTFAALAGAESSMVVEKEISPVAAVAGSVGAERIFELEARFERNGHQTAARKSSLHRNGGARKIAQL
jgi:2-methylisocitrate lyase-like PEP mutase family enzyme